MQKKLGPMVTSLHDQVFTLAAAVAVAVVAVDAVVYDVVLAEYIYMKLFVLLFGGLFVLCAGFQLNVRKASTLAATYIVMMD